MIDRAEDILRATIRWYFIEAVCFVCFVAAATEPGFQRLWFGLLGLFAGTAAIRLRLGDGSAVGKLSRLAQGFAGVGAVLLGTALTGLGGILGWAGSYGIIVAIIFIPMGIALVMVGVGLTKVAFSEIPKTADSEWQMRARLTPLGTQVSTAAEHPTHAPPDQRPTSLSTP